MEKLLSVKDLKTHFFTREGVVHAVNGVSFDLEEGETLGIVGESGCGKSVSMLSLLRLVPDPPGKIISGSVKFNNIDLLSAPEKELRAIRGKKISIVFQDPMTYFNPVIQIGKQVAEPYILHNNVSEKEAEERVIEMFSAVGIPKPEERVKDYPHQFSGGMRQRAMIAMALICSPQIIIADEPTTALDVTVQAQIIDMVKKLRDELDMSIIWITHDLGVIAGLAQRVIVMYAGFIIEESPVKDLYTRPLHPYTMGLLDSLPRLDMKKNEKLNVIEGIPPVMYKDTKLCPFAPRCPFVIDKCLNENPPLVKIDDKRSVACWVDVETGRERK
ncbi:MAG: ABC transporter ATP-binding protein [Anaerolineaceae bacterium]|nr:ABC transporter ATP-binding protein [Anaerolineaceae bacterium]